MVISFMALHGGHFEVEDDVQLHVVERDLTLQQTELF